MTKVYGVYFGCIYEGGGTAKCLYLSRDSAMKHALHLLKEEEEKYSETWAKSSFTDLAERYRWKQIGDGHWNNSVDEIIVEEFDVKP